MRRCAPALRRASVSSSSGVAGGNRGLHGTADERLIDRRRPGRQRVIARRGPGAAARRDRDPGVPRGARQPVSLRRLPQHRGLRPGAHGAAEPGGTARGLRQSQAHLPQPRLADLRHRLVAGRGRAAAVPADQRAAARTRDARGIPVCPAGAAAVEDRRSRHRAAGRVRGGAALGAAPDQQPGREPHRAAHDDTRHAVRPAVPELLPRGPVFELTAHRRLVRRRRAVRGAGCIQQGKRLDTAPARAGGRVRRRSSRPGTRSQQVGCLPAVAAVHRGGAGRPRPGVGQRADQQEFSFGLRVPLVHDGGTAADPAAGRFLLPVAAALAPARPLLAGA